MGVPLWWALILFVVSVMLVSPFVKAKKKALPKVHVSWEPSQTLWSRAFHGTEQLLQLVGWAVVTSSDTKETLLIRSAYIKGTKPVTSTLDVVVPPERPARVQITTILRPFIAKENKDLKVQLILVDHKNREYKLQKTTFRMVGQAPQKPAQAQTPATE
jgi:hypothetical protein